MVEYQRQQRGHVLLAEDDAAMRDVLIAALRALPRDVVAVPNGSALLCQLLEAQAAHLLPELVVSDIFMPEMTGLKVLTAARRHGIGIDFIFITGFGNDDAVEEATALGALAVFEKPFDVEELCSLVQRPRAHGRGPSRPGAVGPPNPRAR